MNIEESISKKIDSKPMDYNVLENKLLKCLESVREELKKQKESEGKKTQDDELGGLSIALSRMVTNGELSNSAEMEYLAYNSLLVANEYNYDDEGFIRDVVRKSSNSEILEMVFEKATKDKPFFGNLFLNENIPTLVQIKIAGGLNENNKLTLSEKTTIDEVFSILAKDESIEVRRGLLNNKNLPDDILNDLAKDSNKEVSEKASRQLGRES